MLNANVILGTVEPDAWASVGERCAIVELERGSVLHHPGEDLTQVYFPTSAVIAVGAETVAGESLNVALVGYEGAIGLFEACGSRQVHAAATVQMSGATFRLSAGAYRRLFLESPALRSAVHRYIELRLLEAQQLVACNALHTVDNRLARVLLDLCDKGRGQHLQITHHALSQVIGVQRTTVAAAVSALQRRGLVRSGRGVVDITDQRGLETVACQCRQTLAFTKGQIYSGDAAPCEA